MEYIEGKNRNVWKLTTSKKKYKFDQVIVATTPRAAQYFLPEGEQKELLATAIARTPPNDVYLARVSGYDETGLPVKQPSGQKLWVSALLI